MKKLLVVVLVLAAVLLGTVVGIASYANSPKVVVRKSVEDTIEELLAREELAPVVNALEKGSIELNASADVKELGLKGELGGKVYFGKDDIYFENIFAEYKNDETDIDIDISFDAYANEDYAYISNEDILDGTYGIIKGKMAEAFKKSVFAYGSDSDYAIKDEETYNAVVAVLEKYDDGLDEDLAKDVEKYAEKYVKVLVKSIEKHASYDSDKDEVKIAGEFRKARIITVSLDEEAMLEIAEDVVEKIKDDKKLRKVFIKYAEDLYAEIAMISGMEAEDFDAAEAYDDMIEELSERFDDVDEEELPKFKVTVKLFTRPNSSTLMKMSVLVKTEDMEKSQQIVSIDFGKKGIKKSDSIVVDIGEDFMSYEYEIKENTSKQYTAVLSMTKYSYSYENDKLEKNTYDIFKVSINKKEDTLKITIGEDDAKIEIKGTFEQKGKKTTISVNKLEMYGEKIEGFEVKIVVDEKDSMPKTVKKGNVNNILSVSKENVQKIMENAYEIFGIVGEALPDFGEDIYG